LHIIEDIEVVTKTGKGKAIGVTAKYTYWPYIFQRGTLNISSFTDKTNTAFSSTM
jgi:hypothetical protein